MRREEQALRQRAIFSQGFLNVAENLQLFAGKPCLGSRFAEQVLPVCTADFSPPCLGPSGAFFKSIFKELG